MAWTKDRVVEFLESQNGYKKFLNERGVLLICVDNVDLLFFYAYDKIEIFYKKLIDRDVDLSSVKEFCKYAQPYLMTVVSNHRYQKLITRF